MALTLHNRGDLYTVIQRWNDADKALSEALIIYSQLAADESAYLPNLASTLISLSDVYLQTQRWNEADAVLSKVFKISRDLAKANEQAYLPYVAMTYSIRACFTKLRVAMLR